MPILNVCILFCCSSDELDGTSAFTNAPSTGNNGGGHVGVR